MVLKGIGCNGYGKPSTTQGFPFLQYLCLWQPALFMIPFCQETNGNRNPSVWSHKHKDLISHLLRNHRIYLIKELGNLFCIITEEVTTRGAGRSHLPWAVSVLRHVCAGQRATLQPRGSSVGSDEVLLPVSPVLNVSQAPPTGPPGPRLLVEGLESWKAIKEKGDPKLHTASLFSPKENAGQ